MNKKGSIYVPYNVTEIELRSQYEMTISQTEYWEMPWKCNLLKYKYPIKDVLISLINKETNLNKILFLIIKLIIAKYNSPSSGITLSHSSLWFSFLVLTMEITLITHSGYTRIDFIKLLVTCLAYNQYSINVLLVTILA